MRNLCWLKVFNGNIGFVRGRPISLFHILLSTTHQYKVILPFYLRNKTSSFIMRSLMVKLDFLYSRYIKNLRIYHRVRGQLCGYVWGKQHSNFLVKLLGLSRAWVNYLLHGVGPIESSKCIWWLLLVFLPFQVKMWDSSIFYVGYRT